MVGLGVGATAGIVAAPIALTAAGFTASGVAGGSLAAWAQSTFYGGATGGLFSLLQSAGAAGLGAAGYGTAAAVGGATGVAGVGAKKVFENVTGNSEEDPKNKDEDS